MSGIEIAGLILGALPVLIEAVDLSRDAIAKSKIFFRRRMIISKLARALHLQQRTLAETIKSILIQSGCREVWRLEADPIECLGDTNIRCQVVEYLGPENDTAFNWALEQSRDSVQRVARQLAGLVPALVDPTDDLLQIIKANEETKQRQFDLISRVKLIFSATKLNEAISELDDSTNSFCRFTTVVSSNRQPVEQDSSRQAIKLGKTLRQVRRFAVDLHQAILRAWRTECHNHEAKLFLDDKIDAAADMKRLARKDEASLPAMVFHLMFVASLNQQPISWHEAPVQVSRELIEEDDDPVKGSQNSEFRHVKVVSPQATPIKTKIMPFVNDICALKESVKNEQIALVLRKDQKMGKLYTSEKMCVPCCHADKISLKTILHNSPVARMPLRHSMVLALRLASNLLQLSRTEWLRAPWSDDTIYFLSTTSPAGDHTQIDFCRPFVMLTVKADNSIGASSTQQNVDPKVALLELGIVLLEIWHNKTLDIQFSQNNPKEYYERLALASKWLDDMTDPMPELYDKAVSHCIRGMMGGETRYLDWEDSKFWSAVCQDVISPLYKNCKQWR